MKTYRLTDIGPARITRDITAPDMLHVGHEIRKHLPTMDFTLSSDDGVVWYVIAKGRIMAGRVERLKGDIASA